MFNAKDAMIAKMFMKPTPTPSAQSSVKVSETGKPVEGEGHGTSDDVPAEVVDENDPSGEVTPAKLSKGEFVITADVVKKLGKGNPELGAAILQQMMDQVNAQSEPEIDQNQVPSGLKSLLGAG